jgi:hypothetical protein
MALRRAAAYTLLAVSTFAGPVGATTYFPLRIGNWWAYEEEDAQGQALSRETWSVVEADARSRADEFHVRSYTKRLDGLGRSGYRFERHEYLRQSGDGLRKRYPAERDAELDVLLVKEPPNDGARWRDAQGSCEVTARGTCAGPHGRLDDCVVVVCTLGEPPATIVTSTYAGGIGMVRQEVDVLQLLPVVGGPIGVLPSDERRDGHSVLRLRAYHVRSR